MLTGSALSLISQRTFKASVLLLKVLLNVTPLIDLGRFHRKFSLFQGLPHSINGLFVQAGRIFHLKRVFNRLVYVLQS